MTLVPVILSGGTGSRLWPLSRKSFPKPFVALPDGESLIQKTLLRVINLGAEGPILTVTNRDYYFLTRDTYAACAKTHQGKIPDAHYLLEPEGRNTTPAMAAAALWAREMEGDDAVLLSSCRRTISSRTKRASAPPYRARQPWPGKVTSSPLA